MTEERKMMSWDEGNTWISEKGFRLESKPVSRLSIRQVDGKPVLKAGSDEEVSPLLGSAVKEMSGVMGMSPTALLKITDTSLRDQVTAHLFEKGISDKNVFLAFGGGAVRGFFRSEEEYMGPNKVFDKVHRILGNDGGIADLSYQPGSGQVHISATSSHSLEPPKRVGDVTQSGISVGINGGVEVRPYLFRMVCLNGLVTERSISCSQVSNLEDLQTVLEWSREELKKFVELDEVQVANPEQAVVRASRELNLPDRATRGILEQLPQLGDDVTAYDVVNLVTQMAHTRGQTFQLYGGRLMNVLHRERCGNCGSVLL